MRQMYTKSQYNQIIYKTLLDYKNNGAEKLTRGIIGKIAKQVNASPSKIWHVLEKQKLGDKNIPFILVALRPKEKIKQLSKKSLDSKIDRVVRPLLDTSQKPAIKKHVMPNISPALDARERLDILMLYGNSKAQAPNITSNQDITPNQEIQKKRNVIEEMALNLKTYPQNIYTCLDYIRYECQNQGLNYFEPKLKDSLAEIYKKIEGEVDVEDGEKNIDKRLKFQDLVFICCLGKTLEILNVHLCDIYREKCSRLFQGFLSFLNHSIEEYKKTQKNS